MTPLQIAEKFYCSFQAHNYEGMNECYAEDAKFSDNIFVDLDGKEVRAMWKMLVTRGSTKKIPTEVTFKVISHDEKSVETHWEAIYYY